MSSESQGELPDVEAKLNTCLMLPRNAFDTHVHVFDPVLGPYADGRAYTPEDAPLKKLIAFNQSIAEDHLSNTLVLVQPSPYKNDCAVMMQCLQKLKNQDINAFGIAVLDLDRTSDAQLREMHDIGIRGLRLNFQADGKKVSTDGLIFALRRTADRIRGLPGWMIQLFVPGWTWDELHDTIRDLPVKIIADHIGGMMGSSKLPAELKSVPTSQPGFRSLLSLSRIGNVIVKISGLYRMSNDSLSAYSDLQPIIQTLAEEIPEQLIWGSDWPHTGEGKNRLQKRIDSKEPFRIIDNVEIINQLNGWMGSDGYRKVMVGNPAQLFRH